jgi:hypothetical protein
VHRAVLDWRVLVPTLVLTAALGCGSRTDNLTDTSTDASGGCGCVTTELRWGIEQALVTVEDESTLDSCDRFAHQRRGFLGQKDVTASCEQPVNDCSNAVTIGDVARALAHPDVHAAVTNAPIEYGRPVVADIGIFSIRIGGALIRGHPCGFGCTPFPPGVAALAKILQALTEQELSRAPCSQIIPRPR